MYFEKWHLCLHLLSLTMAVALLMVLSAIQTAVWKKWPLHIGWTYSEPCDTWIKGQSACCICSGFGCSPCVFWNWVTLNHLHFSSPSVCLKWSRLRIYPPLSHADKISCNNGALPTGSTSTDQIVGFSPWDLKWAVVISPCVLNPLIPDQNWICLSLCSCSQMEWWRLGHQVLYNHTLFH